MDMGNIRRCMVCKTIELGDNALIPNGKYQLVDAVFSDGILSRECFTRQYEDQLNREQLEKILSNGKYYESCRNNNPR